MIGPLRCPLRARSSSGGPSKVGYVDGMTLQEVAMRTAAGLPAVTHIHPFGPDHEVFKVAGRVFMMATDAPGEPIVTVKCEPLLAEALRCEFETITPGYHMNKRHWISIAAGRGITERLVQDLVADAYELVIAGLPKSERPLGATRH